MAFSLSKESNKISVIARCDDSLLVEDQEEFENTYLSYLEDLNENKLKFIDGKLPTRFILKRNLNLSEHIKIKNDQFKMNSSKEFIVQMGSQIEEIRLSLIDIENPSDRPDCVTFKADGSGGATKDLIEKLVNSGITDDLHLALSFARKTKQINKKN